MESTEGTLPWIPLWYSSFFVRYPTSAIFLASSGQDAVLPHLSRLALRIDLPVSDRDIVELVLCRSVADSPAVKENLAFLEFW
jgi:hypothetical protein